MNDETPRTGSPERWMRFAGMGLELATFTLVMAGLGYWIDSYRQHETPYGLAVGTLIGFVMGMTRFIFQAMKNIQGGPPQS